MSKSLSQKSARRRDCARGRIGILLCGAALVASSFVADEARSETLFEAMVSAYVSNPSLSAARKSLKVTDEGVAQAHSGWRPTVRAAGEIVYDDLDSSPQFATDGDVTRRSYSVTIQQPIFRGFRTINAVREARANVKAGRQELKSSEQSTLLNTVVAYMDVVRDEAIVRLRKNNVSVLNKQLKATGDRFRAGTTTKTDVAQARARLAGARSLLSLAQANLKVRRATYKRIVGHQPRGVRQPGRLEHVLPTGLDAAMAVGMSENPEIIAAQFRTKASRHAVDKTRGELLPELNLEAVYSHSDDPSVLLDRQDSATVAGRLTVPLYQAGAVSSRIRQSKQAYRQQQDLLADTRNKVNADIVSAWSQLESARAQLISDQAQVSANETALKGVREEERVGQRTLLDVLDAEQEKLNSQVALVGTQRDLVVASFGVLFSVGRLTASDLGLPVEYYDPTEHYDEVRRKWYGFGERLPRER